MQAIYPANISSAGLIQLLEENDGIGLMIESEMDTLVNATSQDWGNYTEVLRKGFENEDYSFYRKTDREYSFIKRVKLSACLSGTPGQFRALMKSTENGLFSRCYYYVFENESAVLKCYNRLNPNGEIEKEFSKYSDMLLEYYKMLLVYPTVNTIFRINQLSKIQENLQTEFALIFPIKQLHANVKRAFIGVQKIATILFALDMCEKDNVEEQQFCNDLHLNVALTLSLTYLRHSYRAFEMLPKQTLVLSPAINVSHQRLLSVLPKEFSRAEAVKLGLDIGIKLRTVDYILNTLKAKGILELSNHGKYQKIM